MPYTRMFASLSLFVCVATVAHGQAGPMTKKAPTAPTVIEGSDLVVSSIKFDHDFGRTAQWAVAVSPYLRILVLVKNQGNVLWASRGRVEASLENANLDRTTVVAAPPRRDGPSSGVSVAPPSSRGGNRVSGAGAFRVASAPIPGSIRPGDSAFVFMYARTRMGGDSVSMMWGSTSPTPRGSSRRTRRTRGTIRACAWDAWSDQMNISTWSGNRSRSEVAKGRLR